MFAVEWVAKSQHGRPHLKSCNISQVHSYLVIPFQFSHDHHLLCWTRRLLFLLTLFVTWNMPRIGWLEVKLTRDYSVTMSCIHLVTLSWRVMQDSGVSWVKLRKRAKDRQQWQSLAVALLARVQENNKDSLTAWLTIMFTNSQFKVANSG